MIPNEFNNLDELATEWGELPVLTQRNKIARFFAEYKEKYDEKLTIEKYSKFLIINEEKLTRDEMIDILMWVCVLEKDHFDDLSDEEVLETYKANQ